MAATAVGAVGALYRGLYLAVARLAGALLARRRGVRAVYLTRGGAKGEITPGVSDLDFVVVVDDELALPALRAAGRALQRATAGLVDYYPNFVASRATLEQRWRTAPAWQYRLHEGRQSWRLLAGEDLLAALPPLAPAALGTACWLELCRWWIVFARLLAEDDFERDVVLRNATCYKAVSELVHVDHLRRTGELRRSRAEALAAERSPLAARLREVAARRFRDDDPELVEATCRFLLDFFVALWAQFQARPFLELRGGVIQELAPPREKRAEEAAEADADAELARHAEALGEHVGRAWGGERPALHLLQSVSWPCEERLLVVDAAAGRAPGAAELAALVGEHRRRSAARAPRLDLVLRLGDVGFPLTPRLPGALHRGLLTPATTPDVFLQLGTPEVYWTDFTAWYLGAWRSNEQWLDASEATRRRLAAIGAGVAAGRIVYPRTPTARGSGERPWAPAAAAS